MDYSKNSCAVCVINSLIMPNSEIGHESKQIYNGKPARLQLKRVRDLF